MGKYEPDRFPLGKDEILKHGGLVDRLLALGFSPEGNRV